MTFHVPETARVTTGQLASNPSDGNNGAFVVGKFFVIASDGGGWEHVSVTIPHFSRCPSWGEMCQVKGIFWDEEDAVMQLHPPKSDYRNHHPYCLHLWRPYCAKIPLPPPDFVGPRP